jgi:hypothetical protein
MKISTWSFPEYEDREKAANQIYQNCGGSKAYENGYNGHYILHILSECENVALAVQYCQGHLGKKIDW